VTAIAVSRAEGVAPRVVIAMRVVVTMLWVFALGACSVPDIGPEFEEEARKLDAGSFECCAEPEKFYPAPLARSVLAVMPVVGPIGARLFLSECEGPAFGGRLYGNAQARAETEARLQPLDILLTTTETFPPGRLMPGRLSHALVYLGNERALRERGWWWLPEFVPHHAAIRAGAHFFDGVAPAARLTSLDRALAADRVVILRPRLDRPAAAHAARRLAASLGTPFNYRFGMVGADGLSRSCTGFVDLAFPGLELTRRQAYGETVILPDDIAAQAIRGEGIDVAGYLTGTKDGHAWRSRFALMVDIASFWGVPDAKE